jgi:hypothetical protein
MRRRARKDENHSAVAKRFAELGCTVLDLSQLGGNAPDLLVGIGGHTGLLCEVKDGSKIPSQQTLSEGQKAFQLSWRGPICVIRGVDEVVDIVNAYRRAK